MQPIGTGSRQRTLGFKLFGTFGMMLALVLITSVVSVMSIEELGGELNQAANVTAKKVEIIGAIQVAAQAMRTGQRGVILYTLMKQPERVSKANSQFLESADQVDRLTGELKPLLVTDTGRQATDEIERSAKAWRPLYAQVVSGSERGDFDGEVKATVDKTFPLADAIDKAAESIRQTQRQLLAQSSADARRRISVSRWLAFGLLLVSLALGGVVLLIVRKATSRLREIAQEMAQGAGQILNAASMVSNTSQSLAQGASEQASSVEETSASTEQISAMAQRNSTDAGKGSEDVEKAVMEIHRAGEALAKMLVSVTEINASSDKIAKIIRVIDDIAFQTNILALNAAVEAARAGEAGMGFAVVADEVRNLAQRCAQAARDTAELIEESIAKSREGKSRVEEVATATNAVQQSATSLKTLVDAVHVGSEEQSRGLKQISQAISQIQIVTQQTAANAEEGAAASEELSAQAASMRSLSSALQLMVNGTESEDMAATPAPARAARHLPRAAASVVLGVLLLGSFAGVAQSDPPPARTPMRWATTLQTGLAETFQLTLGGTFGAGPAWQSRVQTGVTNVLTTGDSLFLYGADSIDAPSRANNWQAGIGYRRPLIRRGRQALSGTAGFQHWRFPSVRSGTRDWLTYENLTYQTSVRALPVTVTSDSWTLLKSPLPTGSLLHTQAWLQHNLLKREAVQVAFRHGPAHTYSWGFYGTQGNRVVRYQTMLALTWKNTGIEGGYRKQLGLQPGIPDNSYWQFGVSRSFLR